MAQSFRFNVTENVHFLLGFACGVTVCGTQFIWVTQGELIDVEIFQLFVPFLAEIFVHSRNETKAISNVITQVDCVCF